MKIIFYGSVLEYTNNEKSFETSDNANIATVRELINELCLHYGERLKEFLLGEDTCFFLVNGAGLMMTGGLNTKLQPGDKIEVLPFADAG